MSEYQNENNELVTNLIRKRFLNAYQGNKFPGDQNLNGLELIVDRKCNLGCKYCYYDKYGEEYFPKGTLDKKAILDNAKLVAKWVKDEKVFPDITLFSADILYRDIGIKLIEIFADYSRNGGRVSIPTNATFIADEKQLKKVEDAVADTSVTFSLSIEGKYCEHSRPYKGKQIENRDDDYYEKVFQFAKKHCCGFHPMIHSSNIRDWKKNIDWYIDMLIKYEIHPDHLYLLEVRNNDWSKEELIIYGEFIEYLIDVTFRRICNSDKDVMMDFMFNRRGFNTLSSTFFSVGRGIGCSLQSMLAVRLGDMTIVPCHRLAYKWFEIGKLKLPEFKAYEVKKPELMIGIDSSKTKNFPTCDYCMINELCSSGCLGQQFESSYDLFYPDKNVCQLMHVKIHSQMKAYKKLDMFDEMLSKTSEIKIKQILEFCKINNI